MPRFILAGSVLALSLAFHGTPSLAQMSSYERQKVEQAFNASALQRDPGMFDGTAFVAGTDPSAARRYLNAYIKGANNAVRAVNGLSGAARRSEDGEALAAEANDMLAYAKAMQAALPVLEAGGAAAAPVAAADAGDGLTDAERTPVAEPLDRLDAMMAEGVFDGSAIDRTVTTAEADTFADAFIKDANTAVQQLNRMTGTARRTEGGKALFERVSQRLKEARALNGALARHAEARRDFEAAAVPEAPASTAAATEAPAPAAKAPTGDPATRAALDALAALMADGRYDGKDFDPALSLEAANSFNSEVVAASRAVKEAFEASGDETMRSEVADALNQANRVNGAVFNHRVVVQRREGAERKAKAAAERAERQRLAAVAAATKAAEEQRLKDEAAARVAARANLGPACEAFDKQVMTRRLTRNVPDLFNLVTAPVELGVSLMEADKVLRMSDKIAEGCAKPEFAEVVKLGCSEDPQLDPKAWCEAAAQADEVARAKVLAPFAAWEAIAGERYDTIDELESRDGWATIEGPVSFEKAISFDRFMLVNNADFDWSQQRAVLERLKITPEDDPHYDDVAEFIEEFREGIEDGADRWPALPRPPAGEDTNYGTELGAKIIGERWHTDAEIVDAWLGRASWKIHRNGLGVIERRTLPGYVMFKLPEDPFCQVRSFTLTEQYTGANTFQQAKGVRFGYVRFQDCERR